MKKINGISRKDFLKKSAVISTGITVGWNAKSYSNILGANDRVRVGIVGFSVRTKRALIPSFMDHADEFNFEFTAVSDIWNRRRDECEIFLKDQYGKDIEKARNNEELYDRGDIDAVIIGTADFQHALHCKEAVEAGCDVFVEKPFAETQEDNREALSAVEKSDKIIQVGTQMRSGKNHQMAAEYLHSGKFGDIVSVEINRHVNQPGRWRLPQLVKELREEDTDWNRYLMNRPYEPWNPRKYLEFRLFWPYSSGIPGQWMAHHIDTLQWFTGYAHPRSVAANGGIYKWKDGRNNFDTMTAVFDYGPSDDKTKGFQAIYSSRLTNSAGGVNEIYYSNGGKLDLRTFKVSPEGGLTGQQASVMGKSANLLPELSLLDEMQSDQSAGENLDMNSLHMRNWMECIRARTQPNADVRAGYNHSVANIMTMAALRTGKLVTYEEKSQEVLAGGEVFQY